MTIGGGARQLLLNDRRNWRRRGAGFLSSHNENFIMPGHKFLSPDHCR